MLYMSLPIGSISYSELREAMRRLGAHLSDSELDLIFQSVDMYDNKELSFKEFLVSLCVAYLLNLIPQFETSEQMLYVQHITYDVRCSYVLY